ncbi:MAG TPA: hypothetical protein VHL53_23190, partial [Acidimicrobiia bacterium]|nr:hypothetical protein [Acidimicrobiia bacterium]
MTAVERWPPVPEGSLFGVDNLPFGVFSEPGPPGLPGAPGTGRGGVRRVGVAIGDHVLDAAP